jgi:hypothetical protein
MQSSRLDDFVLELNGSQTLNKLLYQAAISANTEIMLINFLETSLQVALHSTDPLSEQTLNELSFNLIQFLFRAVNDKSLKQLPPSAPELPEQAVVMTTMPLQNESQYSTRVNFFQKAEKTAQSSPSSVSELQPGLSRS